MGVQSCHSGTALDLPYMYHSDGRLKGLRISAFAHARKLRASRADVISFSGCKDSQTSADTVEGGLAVGAMSYVGSSSISLEREHQLIDCTGFYVELEGGAEPDVSRTAQVGASDPQGQV
jgi:hypothetical protein